MSVDHRSPLIKPTTATTMISGFLGSPRLFFNAFFSKNNSSKISDHSPETACNGHNLMSPTSILDAGDSEHHQQQAIGLAIIDSFVHDPISPAVLFGSKLRVQIPNSPISPAESPPKSPADFGIKTRSVPPQAPPVTPSKDLGRQLSLKEMEMSEDYTCVITHGPNPKTTHIYDDCVVERSEEMEMIRDPPPPTNFMSFCHTCKQVLGHNRDIFIYRGEKAFCSEECRCQEMVKSPEFEWCLLEPSK